MIFIDYKAAAPLFDAKCLWLPLWPYLRPSIRDHFEAEIPNIDVRYLCKKIFQLPLVVEKYVNADDFSDLIDLLEFYWRHYMSG
jgi:hypothetical protein